MEAIEEGPKMADYSGPWYRVFDELDSNVAFFVPAISQRVLPPTYFDPITPDVPYEQKLIEVNLTIQGTLQSLMNTESGISNRYFLWHPGTCGPTNFPPQRRLGDLRF